VQTNLSSHSRGQLKDYDAWCLEYSTISLCLHRRTRLSYACAYRSWPVPPFRSTRIIGFCITALPYIAEQGITESLINPFVMRPFGSVIITVR